VDIIVLSFRTHVNNTTISVKGAVLANNRNQGACKCLELLLLSFLLPAVSHAAPEGVPSCLCHAAHNYGGGLCVFVQASGYNQGNVWLTNIKIQDSHLFNNSAGIGGGGFVDVASFSGQVDAAVVSIENSTVASNGAGGLTINTPCRSMTHPDSCCEVFSGTMS
jgi:hypothetical protein